jgi:tetratricopeptide (TPR) repeat protein
MSDSSIANGLLRPPAIVLLAALVASCGDGRQSTTTAPRVAEYVGSESCRDCHTDSYESWLESDHALAMQVATADTVLGDFSGAEFSHYGLTSTFYSRDGDFFVSTDDAEGVTREFKVSYTFGVYPLQQYLVEFPGGRLQPLLVTWDSREVAEGGQRWFHLYPDEAMPAYDPLHWTGREQNWNYMCAECHSTNLAKNYDPASDTFATTWSEINVGCEGCHGPSSLHVTEAEAGEFSSRRGLVADLDDSGRAVWQMNVDTGIAERSELRMRPPGQPEACGRCHARRGIASSDYEFGRSLFDTHMPSMLEEGLYFADGQIQDEVYVYGSFLQSKMYRAGVSCSDCHDPHSATLKTGPRPSDICSTCHLPGKFASPTHHRHADGAVACVDCHMDSRTYMVVDDRRDHSFRIPDPGLSLATGSPNACTNCHEDRDDLWAQATVSGWYGDDRPDHYGYAIHAGRAGAGNEVLVAAALNDAYPGIARGTALSLLRAPYSRNIEAAIQGALGSPDPYVRLGALRAARAFSPDNQLLAAGSLLQDSLRSIRIEAARLASPHRAALPVPLIESFRRAEAELVASAEAIAERPEAQMNLANNFADAGDALRAAEFLQIALDLDPRYTAAWVNLADLYRRSGRDDDAEQLIREGLRSMPADGALNHSLGLLLVRTNRRDEALEHLARAAEGQPDNSRYVYVHAVALNSMSQPQAATDLLADAATRFPMDFDIHWALATMFRDQGRFEEARVVAAELARKFPENPGVEELLSTL